MYAGRVEVGEAAEQIDALIEALFVAVPGECAGLRAASELHGLLVKATRRFDALQIAVLGEVDRNGVYSEDGHTSAVGWAAFNGRSSREVPNRQLKAARAFRDLGSVAAAYQAGDVGSEQVDVLARLRSNPRCGDQLAASETLLLRDAQELAFNDFKVCAQRWEQLADHDGREPDEETVHQRRQLSLSRMPDGGWRVAGRFGGLQGEALNAVIEEFTKTERLADWETARAEHGTNANQSHLGRTATQRRADALVAMALQAASTGPGSQRPEPIVHIIVTQQVVEDEIIRRDGGTPPHRDPVSYRQYRCETINGTPVAPGDVMSALMVGHFRRIMFGPGEASVSRKARLFPGPLRALLDVRDRHCTHPGCDRSVVDCEGDHTEAYRETRNTSIGNGGLRCGSHNRFKEAGYRAWRDPGGTWHTYRPDRTEILPAA